MSARKELDNSTEERIKKAARVIFHKKGFAATRTRDIAEEAGINLALLNYYFRSKERLFNLIMFDTLSQFMQSLIGVFNNEDTTLWEKVEIFVFNYIDLLLVEPGIPLFIMSELRHGNPQELFTRLNTQDILTQSVLAQQYQEAVQKGEVKDLPMIQLLINIMGLSVFPFVASPMIKLIGNLNEDQFKDLMLERKKLIPGWIAVMFKKE